MMVERSSLKKHAVHPAVLFLLVALTGCEHAITLDDSLEEAASRLQVDVNSRSVDLGVSLQVQANASLERFARSAVDHSPIVATARFQFEAAQQQLREERARFRPQVGLTVEDLSTDQAIVESSNPSFAGNESSYTTLETTIRLQQTLFDAPAAASVERAAALIEARSSELVYAEQRVLNTFLTRYLDAVEALERVILAQAETEYYEKVNNVEMRRVGEGDMRASDRGATVSELSRAQSDLSIARADYAIRVRSLCRLSVDVDCPLPRPVSLNLTLPRPEPLTSEEISSLQAAPEFATLNANLTAALREVDRARTRSWPVLSTYVESSERDRGGSLFDGSSLTETVSVGVVFDWQIIQGGGVRAAARRELNEALALDAERSQAIHERAGELEAAVSGLEALWQNDLALQNVIVERARSLRASEREYSEGAVSELELALAQLELKRAEILRHSVRRTFLGATIAREWATGQLNMEMVALIRRLAGAPEQAVQAYGLAR